MTDERLAELERMAESADYSAESYPRAVLGLVAEVRRLKGQPPMKRAYPVWGGGHLEFDHKPTDAELAAA